MNRLLIDALAQRSTEVLLRRELFAIVASAVAARLTGAG
jgi:hypothetical protein